MLVILSGTAGAGKDTVKRELIKRMEDVESLPSITTRAMRKGDVEGGTYFFVSEEEFKKMIDNNEFYEYDMHHNNYYGTPKKILNEKIKSGKIIVKDIDVNGTENLKKILGNEIKIITIYLSAPKEELERRLRQREDRPSDREIALRLNRYDFEEAKKFGYDYIINNSDAEDTVERIMEIIENERKD